MPEGLLYEDEGKRGTQVQREKRAINKYLSIITLNVYGLPYFAMYNAYPCFLPKLSLFALYTHVYTIPMCNVHPYFSLKNLGKKVCIIHGKIR